MRVLLLHNRYRQPGGEERAVRAQAAVLERHGHTVELLERDSAGVGSLTAARGLIRGGLDPAEVERAVRRFGADVVHAHNLHPLFGWRALAAARRAGAATVLSLHNFRLFCAIGVAFRDGRPCHECRGHDTLPGVRHRCRGSAAESAVYAAGLAGQLGPLLASTDRLLALSTGHLALLAGQGLATDRVSVVPNFVPVERCAAASAAAAGRHALVAGRLVAEKGFDTAIRACAAAGVPLVVAGEGPDRARLEALAAAAGGETRFAGWVPGPELDELVRSAGVVLVPSRCEEAFGYGVLDAFAAGVPVLASGRGGLAELVAAGGGTPLDPDHDAVWADALGALWTDPAARAAAGAHAITAVREHWSDVSVYPRLLRAYDAARGNVSGRPGRRARW